MLRSFITFWVVLEVFQGHARIFETLRSAEPEVRAEHDSQWSSSASGLAITSMIFLRTLLYTTISDRDLYKVAV